MCFKILALCILHGHFHNNLHVYSNLGAIHFLTSPLPLPKSFLQALFLENMALFILGHGLVTLLVQHCHSSKRVIK